MTLLLIFLVNAILSFALSLVVAAWIGPEAFGRYALAIAVALAIVAAAFDWLRLSAQRFASDRAEPDVRVTLDRSYAVLTVVIAVGAVAIVSPGIDLGVAPTLLLGAVALGLATALFDGRAALARARFRDRLYGWLLLSRGAGTFAACAAVAVAVAEPASVLFASAGISVLAAAAGHRALRDGLGRTGKASRRMAAAFVRYAMPVVVAGAVYQLFPLLNRAVLASRAGFAEVGDFSLVGEIATRLFQNIGFALDAVLFQIAVRVEETAGRAEAERQVSRNAGLVFAIVGPAAAGLCVTWPSFEAAFVPASFRGRLETVALLVVPGLAIYAFTLFGLGPVFGLRRRTWPVTAAALAGLAADVACLVALPDPVTSLSIAACQLAGFAVALLTLSATAAWAGAALPWRDAGATMLGCAAIVGVIWPTRSWESGLGTLAVQVLTGMVVYAAVAWITDLASVRSRNVAIVALFPRHRRSHSLNDDR